VPPLPTQPTAYASESPGVAASPGPLPLDAPGTSPSDMADDPTSSSIPIVPSLLVQASQARLSSRVAAVTAGA
jgi:hypothetical protein